MTQQREYSVHWLQRKGEGITSTTVHHGSVSLSEWDDQRYMGNKALKKVGKFCPPGWVGPQR